MVKNSSRRRKEAKKRIDRTISILQEQIENLKIDLKEFSEEESSVEQKQEVEVGDRVESLTAPWYNGTVDRVDKNRYWVFLKVGNVIKRKALHNIKVVSKRADEHG